MLASSIEGRRINSLIWWILITLQEADGPHHKHICTKQYNYAITFKEKIMISILRIEWLLIDFPSYKDKLREVGLKLVQFCRRWFLKISYMYLCHFIIISHWKQEWPFIWTNLYPLQARMHCVKFGWNLASDTDDEEF